MYYRKGLDTLIHEKGNPVNRMYLHEIMLKWKNFEKKAEFEKNISNEVLVKSLNSFISEISNRKYRYNNSTKNGFKADSPIYSSSYLADLLTIIIKRTKIFGNVGISWGYQSFSSKLKFNPTNLCTMAEKPVFEFSSSPEILHLAQKIDFQFRVTGKRRFNKYQLVFPLILFYAYKNLTEKDYINIEYYTKQAKSTFEKSKSVIVTETLDDNFKPDLSSSYFDAIFVLRKQFKSDKTRNIQIDVVNKLEKKIRSYCTETQTNGYNLHKHGIIES